MVTSPNATAAKMYIGVRVSIHISQRQSLELSLKIFVVSLEKSYQHDGGCKQKNYTLKKNEALNNVIIMAIDHGIHVAGGHTKKQIGLTQCLEWFGCVGGPVERSVRRIIFLETISEDRLRRSGVIPITDRPNGQ